jgi:hypothetical protein
MAVFLGSVFIGAVFAQVLPEYSEIVFGLVFAFGFWLSMSLSRQFPDTFPLAVFLSINVCLYLLLRSSDSLEAFLHHHSFNIHPVSCIISATCSCLITIAFIKSRKVQKVRSWFRETLRSKHAK